MITEQHVLHLIKAGLVRDNRIDLIISELLVLYPLNKNLPGFQAHIWAELILARLERDHRASPASSC